ncbi:MAG: hypothetical protein ABIK44_01215, partial [candidate division WOR-3 bacterium]
DYRRSEDADIFGARVSPAGVVLDPQGIAISTAVEYQKFPAVAFDGANYLVVWEHYRSGYSDIFGARVSPAGVVLDPQGIAISTAANYQYELALAFDGANYLMVWTDWRSGGESDIYGARVSPTGVVVDSGPVVRQAGNQWDPALTRGSGGQMFLVYQGWTGTVGGRTYNAYRIWGKLNPSPGIGEGRQPTANNSQPPATIVRAVLFLPSASGVAHGASSVLLDITGRKVMELSPGANDVSRLAPGVYFVTPHPDPLPQGARESGVARPASSVRKVVVVR